jgi:Ca-activated chloride channel family protein
MVVYNFPMARLPASLALAIGCLASLTCQGQVSEAKVSISPRTRPEREPVVSDFPGAHLRVDSSLVLVPVHVMSAMGAPITNLTAGSFRLFEDGVEQKIATFSNDDVPLSVGLVFDSSASMSNKIRTSTRAAEAFFRTANANDEFFLIEFSDKPRLAMPFTLDADLISQKISRVRPFGRTSLIDAVHLALLQMKNAKHSRKALIILSDGGDNRSRLTRLELKEALLESDVQLYAMGIFDGDLLKRPDEEANGPRLLTELADYTGGRSYPVEHLDDLISISATIGSALRHEYLIGYSPQSQVRDGKYRRISLRLVDTPADGPAAISYRHGYYAPIQ